MPKHQRHHWDFGGWHGLTFPGYRYCGPFNPLQNGLPTNRLDRACRKHDYAYNKIGWKSYLPTHHSYKVDKELVSVANKESGIVPRIVTNYFGGKHNMRRIEFPRQKKRVHEEEHKHSEYFRRVSGDRHRVENMARAVQIGTERADEGFVIPTKKFGVVKKHEKVSHEPWAEKQKYHLVQGLQWSSAINARGWNLIPVITPQDFFESMLSPRYLMKLQKNAGTASALGPIADAMVSLTGSNAYKNLSAQTVEDASTFTAAYRPWQVSPAAGPLAASIVGTGHIYQVQGLLKFHCRGKIRIRNNGKFSAALNLYQVESKHDANPNNFGGFNTVGAHFEKCLQNDAYMSWSDTQWYPGGVSTPNELGAPVDIMQQPQFNVESLISKGYTDYYYKFFNKQYVKLGPGQSCVMKFDFGWKTIDLKNIIARGIQAGFTSTTGINSDNILMSGLNQYIYYNQLGEICHDTSNKSHVGFSDSVLDVMFELDYDWAIKTITYMTLPSRSYNVGAITIATVTEPQAPLAEVGPAD